jgi:hypothetical protein
MGLPNTFHERRSQFMQAIIGIPRGVAISIADLLDHCAEIKAGQEVVLLAHVDGLYGGDNLVDPQVIAWLQAAINYRGGNASILWIDEPVKPYAWRIPPLLDAALKACDVLMIHSFDLSTEEFAIGRKAVEYGATLVRNFATTASLLNSTWAQTPHELVSQIRYQVSTLFEEGKPFQLKDDNGTHLEGTIAPPNNPAFPTYTTWRNSGLGVRPFPEWVFPPINVRETSGYFVFDRMLSWWSRYVGIYPFFKDPIQLTIEKNRIKKIEGGEEAVRLRQFLAFLEQRIDDSVYNFPSIHSGVHPQAEIGPHQCASPLYRRMIEHGHCCNIHVHIGGQPRIPKYPYWTHITGDIRSATWRVGDTLVHDRGHLTALDHPDVLAVAAKYPDRPGLKPEPRHY